MVAALAGVESGTVKWSILAASQDTNDADREPNFGSFRGAVMFTPSRNSVRRLLPTPYTIFLDPVLGNVGDDGILRDLSGLEGVVLVSPFATGIEETGWTWDVSFELNQREKVSFPIQFLPDEVVDLSRITPVLSSPGIVMTKGDTGSLVIGTVTTGTPGTPADVDNVGTPTDAILNFVIPKGDMPRLQGTSTSSVAIGTGAKSFTVQPGMDLPVGAYVRIASQANGANYMGGNVTAYNSTTGVLDVSVADTAGSGTLAAWNVYLSGARGPQGVTGAVPVISGTSTTSFTPGLGSKVFVTQASVPAFTVGQYVRLASAAASGEYMAGLITAYSGTSLTVNVLENAGGTARADWNISISGTRGATGNAATVAVGTVTTGTAGSSATVVNGGTVNAATLNFTIPKGDQGIQGIQGTPGDLSPSDSANWTGNISLAANTAWQPPYTHVRTLSGNSVITALPDNMPGTISGTLTVIVKQAATGGPFTLTWPAALEWAGDAPAPTAPTVANAEMIVYLFWTGVAWRAFYGGTFFP